MTHTDERVTPTWLYAPLHEEFQFRLDAAATVGNAKCLNYCGLDAPGVQADGVHRCHGDGLTTPWAGFPVVWINPPYSRGSILQWCAKAEMESMTNGCTVVLLLPGDTSTEYFHRYVLRHECRFINRRLSFAGAPLNAQGKLAPAKFGSVLTIMRPSHELWTWR